MKNLMVLSPMAMILQISKKRLKKMKALSKWAKVNPKSSRGIIAITHLLVVINAIFFGTLLFIFNWGESRWLLILAGNLFFISYIFYPQKNKKNKQPRSSYLRQKSHDFSLVILYSIVISLGVNNFLMKNNQDYNLVRQPKTEFIVYKPKIENHKTNRKKLRSTVKQKLKKYKKQIKRELRKLKKELKRQNNKAGVIALKFLLVLMTIAIAAALAYVIAIFACSLSCSGREGLAWAVSILGFGGIIWLGFISLKYIFTKVGKKND